MHVVNEANACSASALAELLEWFPHVYVFAAGRFPLYHHIKLLVVLWMIAPQTQVTQLHSRGLIHQLLLLIQLLQHETPDCQSMCITAHNS